MLYYLHRVTEYGFAEKPYELICNNCLKPYGRVDFKELAAIQNDLTNPVAGFCFDCEAEFAARTGHRPLCDQPAPWPTIALTLLMLATPEELEKARSLGLV